MINKKRKLTPLLLDLFVYLVKSGCKTVQEAKTWLLNAGPKQVYNAIKNATVVEVISLIEEMKTLNENEQLKDLTRQDLVPPVEQLAIGLGDLLANESYLKENYKGDLRRAKQDISEVLNVLKAILEKK